MQAISGGQIYECFFPKIQRKAIFVAKNELQCPNENLLNYYG
jgi:hypothetical protein